MAASTHTAVHTLNNMEHSSIGTFSLPSLMLYEFTTLRNRNVIKTCSKILIVRDIEEKEGNKQFNVHSVSS